MRRYFALVLLLVAFSLSLLTPLLLAGAEQTNLPACCRRDGNHHCAPKMGKPAADGVQMTALSVCPFFFSGKLTPAPVQPGAVPLVPTRIAVTITVENSLALRRRTRHLDDVIRSWQQRGPPSLVS